MDNQIFRGSIPHNADIKKLKNAFPVESLSPGVEIPYDRVESVLQSNRRSSRFRSITHEWRRDIENSHGIILGTMHGKAFYVANSKDMLKIGTTKLQVAGKYATRARQITSCADVGQLDADERARLTHIQNVAGTIALSAQTQRPKVLPEI